jgi:hypothetical protein|tara:strand:+ start:251 stop:514 length:264 start_codon:yes stop_codon:yes gene_type:complete
MDDKIFIKAITTLIINNAMENLEDIANAHYKSHDIDFNNNMFMLGMIGNAITTGKDKAYLLEVFQDLAAMQREDEENDLINEAKKLI